MPNGPTNDSSNDSSSNEAHTRDSEDKAAIATTPFHFRVCIIARITPGPFCILLRVCKFSVAILNGVTRVFAVFTAAYHPQVFFITHLGVL